MTKDEDVEKIRKRLFSILVGYEVGGYKDNIDPYFVPEIIKENWEDFDIDGLIEIDINYAGKRAIRFIDKDSILELASKLRKDSNKILKENKLIEKFLCRYYE